MTAAEMEQGTIRLQHRGDDALADGVEMSLPLGLGAHVEAVIVLDVLLALAGLLRADVEFHTRWRQLRGRRFGKGLRLPGCGSGGNRAARGGLACGPRRQLPSARRLR